MLAPMSQPAPKRSRVRDLLTKPIRLPQWFSRRTRHDDPRIFSFNDERDAVVAEVSARAVAACLGDRLELLLNESAHREIARLEKQRDDEAREWLGFWQTVARKLARMSDAERRETLRQVVESMARDIAGNFDPRVYNFSQRVIPGLIAGVMNPKQLAVDAVQAGHVGAERLVTLTGELDSLRSLARIGTLIVVPTHSSNLDSLAIGESLAREDLPPVVYGAGKNLFTNPIVSFFMHNLGAYRIDRRIQTTIYKQVLKTYSCVMIERGYHSLFFPGGTRSRSGMIEGHLKLGLAGTAIEAFARNAIRAKPRNERPTPIFFVPVTINYALVLEAESLVEDYLKEKGQARYIIEDDEFSQLDRWLAFFRRLTSYGSACVLRYGAAIDPFGNRVDAQGHSLAPSGDIIDPVSYITHRGEPVLDPTRDAAYTRELGRELVEHYRRETVLMTTQVVAHILFRRLVRETPGVDLFGRVRRRGEITWDYADYVTDFLETRERLRGLAAAGRVHLNTHLETDSAERAFERATEAWNGYHTRTMVRLDGDGRIVIEDPGLLLYYQNRLVPFAESIAGEQDQRAAREIAALAGGLR
jgi:glycerol-3-phosphate O-acyltransferase